MDLPQWVAILLGPGVIGATIPAIIGWMKDARRGRDQARRIEVDRAERRAERAEKEVDEVEEDLHHHARWSRIMEESLAIHRRYIIDAPCLGPDSLPMYPSRPGRNTK